MLVDVSSHSRFSANGVATSQAPYCAGETCRESVAEQSYLSAKR